MSGGFLFDRVGHLKFVQWMSVPCLQKKKVNMFVCIIQKSVIFVYQKTIKQMNVMVVILTNFNSDRKCLVNMSNVETCYVVWDTKEEKYKTKICFRGNESYIFVEESLQEIHKLIVDQSHGVFQSSDWETKSIVEHLENHFKYRPELSKDLFEDFKY